MPGAPTRRAMRRGGPRAILRNVAEGMRIAVLNVGTGTVKAALVEATARRARVLASETATRRDGGGGDGADEGLEPAFAAALAPLAGERVDAVAHRVVHGGVEFREPVIVDAAVEQALEKLVPLAPLHNPPALAGLRLARRRFPDRTEVAVFDTAFHADRPRASRLYALPWDLAQAQTLYRFGFHGIAHASLVEGLAREDGRSPREVDAVTLQLGAGCSACAVVDGRSVETSMGFTPLEGLPMATRSGDVDAGVVLHLLRRGRSVDEVERLLNRDSGLRGLAGSDDLREVLEAEARGEERAAVAVELFVRRIVATVGAYWTLIGGRGSLVFGGGIGTNSAEIRRRVAEGLGAWNVALDPERNASGAPGRISAPGSRPVWALRTEEEPLIARAAAALLEGGGAADEGLAEARAPR